MALPPVYRPPSLYEALKAEGFILPDECGDCSISLPVDGNMQLICRINITPANVAQIGRALVRLVVTDKARREHDEHELMISAMRNGYGE